MKKIFQWASWLVSAIAIIFMIIGSLGYLLGNILIFGARWNTYYLFAGYFMPLAILLILLGIYHEKCKG